MASSLSSPTILMLLSTVVLFSLLITPALATNILNSGQWLGFGQSLVQGKYKFTMQEDCNLILYDNNNAIWSTGTNGKGSGCILKLQMDGNLVIYSKTRSVIWASNTNRQKGTYFLILQSDRNAVIYDNFKHAIWTTRTNKIVKAAVVVIPHSNDTTTTSCATQNKVKELYP